MRNKKEADSDYRGLILSLIMLGSTNADTVMKKRTCSLRESNWSCI